MLRNLKSFNLPEIEEKVLKFWKENQIFEKSLANRKNKRKFVFFEGPPSANGRPGLHHVLARSFKDIILRYKTMAGFFVPRRGGWDTHGLPVEIGVEKELGLKSKKEIEKFGIAAFNKKCKELVWKYKDEWEKMTERTGFWIDLDNPYITYDNNYIETLWWIFKKIWEKKLLYKGYKVIPWCYRCGTGLSSHELALGYKFVPDKSLYVNFQLEINSIQKINNWKIPKNTYIISWTTTPWTLPGNVALAIKENIQYIAVKILEIEGVLKNIQLEKENIYIFGNNEESEMRIFGKKINWEKDNKSKVEIFELGGNKVNVSLEKIKVFSGKKLEGIRYKPLFAIKQLQSKTSHKIYAADFVTITDGTGVVHIAPMYGENDYNLGQKFNLPQHHTVDEQGNFTKEVPKLSGMPVKTEESGEKILEYLKHEGNFLKTSEILHDYPFCWRCNSPLIYYARDSWFIAMSKLRKNLLSENEKINWIPGHIKNGRFGEWLKEAKDWAISRERYWGTPLPIWQCSKCSHTSLVGNFNELETLQKQTKNKYILLRHGESENNIKNINNCWPEKKKYHLTLKGRIQAEKAGAKLKDKDEKIDLIFSSDINRAKETAKIIADILKIKKINFDKRLREINIGVFNGRKSQDYHKYFSSDAEKFTKQPPKGETLSELRLRLFEFLRETEKKYKNKKILIISHEYPLWMAESAMKGWTDKEALKRKHGPKSDFLETGEFTETGFRLVPRDETGQMDVHRPYIDEINFPCPKCNSKMKRINEVADVWFDSGAMPFAQNHYPFNPKMDFPADFISEGIDQTRGWFYTLLAVSILLDKKAPYKNVISLGLLLDKNGQKMSKSKGNVIEPGQMIQKYGADAVRWYSYTINSPGEPKWFNEEDLAKTLRQFILLIYNSFVFFETYADKKQPKNKKIKSNILDKWIISRLNETILEANKKLEKYGVTEAAKIIEEFASDLSRWYIRRSRKRFQKPENQKDYIAASQTLKLVLMNLVKILSPFIPFFGEALYKSLENKKESVHLEDWPKADKKLIDKKLSASMAEIRQLASLGLAKRAELGIKVRQPLSELKIKNRPSGNSPKAKTKLKIDENLLDILKDEVNVKEIIFDPKIENEIELNTEITPELRQEGITREIVRMVQDLRQKAGYEPKDEIYLWLEVPEEIQAAVGKNLKEFKKSIRAKNVEFRRAEKVGAQSEAKFDSFNVWLGINKI